MLLCLAPVSPAQSANVTVPVGKFPIYAAVNPVTNKIYVANFNDGTVTVIDGVTNQTTTVQVGGTPKKIAINTVTDRIYVIGDRLASSGRFAVIDGTDNSVTSLTLKSLGASDLGVNETTNRIHVAGSAGKVAVVDGFSKIFSTVDCSNRATAVAVNEDTNKIYIVTSNAADDHRRRE